MQIYISGGISGVKNYADNFANAEKVLRNDGYDVINPARVMSQFPIDTPYIEYIENSLRLLDKCDAIYMLRDYQDSCGARIELLYAMATGKSILYEVWKKEKDGVKI